MSVLDAVRNLQNETEWQKSKELQQAIKDSLNNSANRNTSGVMGKNDFLKLLAAQLRFQNPLEPTSDADFASQLAQFSSLEQMQNMNETLNSLASYQAFGLVGKTVSANVEIEGEPTNVSGIVESIFTRDGVTYALVFDGVYDYTIPVGTITGVFDTSAYLTSDKLLQTSSNLIGRTVMAQVGDDIIEGIVTRIAVDSGIMFARIEAEDGTETFVPVGAIFDVRETGTPGNPMPVDPEDPVEDEDTQIDCPGDEECICEEDIEP